MKNNLSEYENKVLNYLRNNPGLTKKTAVIELHIMHVGDTIHRLRKYGYNIIKEWKSSANQKRYAEYKLSE